MNGATALAGLRRDVDLTSTGADALAATSQGARTTSLAHRRDAHHHRATPTDPA